MTAHHGTLAEEAIRGLLDTLEQLLRDPTVSVHVARGISYHDNYETGLVEAEPTDGRTITIEVHGGAREEHESDVMKLARLWRETGRPGEE